MDVSFSGVVATGVVGRLVAVISAAQSAKDSPFSLRESTPVIFTYVTSFLLLDLRESGL